jgi:hypothetical protein
MVSSVFVFSLLYFNFFQANDARTTTSNLTAREMAYNKISLQSNPLPATNINLALLTSYQGFSISSEPAYADTGYSVGGLGDVNGDGTDDLVVGAPNDAPSVGKAYVIYGGTSLTNIALSNLPTNQGFSISGVGSNFFTGYSVSNAGDMNGDGKAEILIGAKGFSTGGPVGRVFVIFGGTSLSDISLSNLLNNQGFSIVGETNDDQAGYSVSRAGDFNHDGKSDIVIGAPYSTSSKGKIYVIYGASSLSGINLPLTSSTKGFAIIGAANYDICGYSVSGAGDVNNDGFDDIVIGCPQHDPSPGIGKGMCYIIYGKASTTSDINLANTDTTVWVSIAGIPNYDYLGSSVSGGGDINGDGNADVILGAWRGTNPTTGALTGVSYVVYGRPAFTFTSITLSSTDLAAVSRGFAINGITASEQSGYAVCIVGDVNGDGKVDIAVGAKNAVSGAGRVYLIYGGGSSSNIELSNLKNDQGFIITGILNLGASVSSADINKDGKKDLIIGAPATYNIGKVYVLYGSSSGLRTFSPTSQPTNQPSARPTRQPSSKPTGQPTTQPVLLPTGQPTTKPSRQPSANPSCQPTGRPSGQPSRRPSSQPTRLPTNQPTTKPTDQPTDIPTNQPTSQPTTQPTRRPSTQPTIRPSTQPSSCPSSRPTRQPTVQPTSFPSDQPTSQPSLQPVSKPSTHPSNQPTVQPTSEPSTQPTRKPTSQPSRRPTSTPSSRPSELPSCQPTSQPSNRPSVKPSNQPSSEPSKQPTSQPSLQPVTNPTVHPSDQPTVQPTSGPSTQPTQRPTSQPSRRPTFTPSTRPSELPSCQPTNQPSNRPSLKPSSQPTSQPTKQPTRQPIAWPTGQPTNTPSVLPSSMPTQRPTKQPISAPSTQPTSKPSIRPSGQPSVFPSILPSVQPTGIPSRQPRAVPSERPSGVPTIQPSGNPSSSPSVLPTSQPSLQPSATPSSLPSTQPSGQPVAQPSNQPTCIPSGIPTISPSRSPSSCPSTQPSAFPSALPSQQPAVRPSNQPTCKPTVLPSSFPSTQPSTLPSSQPSLLPTSIPSSLPTGQPTLNPAGNPSGLPTSLPSSPPTIRATSQPTHTPTRCPTNQPSRQPSSCPSALPTSFPSNSPTVAPTVQPTSDPSRQPLSAPTVLPSEHPFSQPSASPSKSPSNKPSSQPTGDPTKRPRAQPSSFPSSQPSQQPSSRPSGKPSFVPFSAPTSRPTSRPFSQPSCRPSYQPTSSPTDQPTSSPTSSSPTTEPTIITESPTPVRVPSISAYPSQTRKPTRHPVTSKPTAKPSIRPSFLISSAPTQTISALSSGNNNHFKESLYFFGSYLGAEETIPNIDLTEDNIGASYIIFGFTQKENPSSEIIIGSRNSDGRYSPILNDEGGLKQEQRMSRSALPIGDFNGDSYEDLLICDPINSKCFVYFGRGVHGFQNLHVSFAIKNINSELFGWSIARLHDANRDGFDDIAISALSSNSIYVFYGSNAYATDIITAELDPGVGIKIIGSRNDQNSGLALSSAGDVNKDGYSDLLFSAIQISPYQNVVYILFLNSKLMTKDTILDGLTPNKDYFKIIAPLFSFAGFSLSNLGDINQDGFDDIIIGSIPYSGKYLTQKSYVIYGGNDSSTLSLSEITEEDGFTITGGGFMVGGPGDVNGDGIPDIMISSYQQWQGKGNSYIMAYPRNVSSPPTFLPSSQPSTKIQFPTSVPTTTSSPPTRYGTFPPNLQRTPYPTHAPKPTQNPSLRPSKPNSPTMTPVIINPTESPTRRPTRLPTTTVMVPSRSPTKRQVPSTFPSSSPSITPTVSLSTPFHDITINHEGVYNIPDGKGNYIVSGEGTFEIISNDRGGKKIYTIMPARNTITITGFNKRYDQISLIHFPYFYSINDLVYRTNPGQIFLSREQKLILSSVEVSELTEENFVFVDASENRKTTQFELTFASMVSFGIFIGCSGLFLCVAKMNEEDDDKKILLPDSDIEEPNSEKIALNEELSSDFSSLPAFSCSDNEKAHEDKDEFIATEEERQLSDNEWDLLSSLKSFFSSENHLENDEEGYSAKVPTVEDGYAYSRHEEDDFRFIREIMEGSSTETERDIAY